MENNSKLLVIIGAALLILSTSSALYYWSQSAYYESEYKTTMNKLARLTASCQAGEFVETVTAGESAYSASLGSKPENQRQGDGLLFSADGVTNQLVMRDSRSSRRSSYWTEIVQTNDPKRYEEKQQRRKAMQVNSQKAWLQTTNYFLNRDTSRMDREEQDEYFTMMELLTEASFLNQQLQSELPPEVRRQFSQTLRSNVVAVLPLLENERDREYYDVAIAFGHSEEDAATMVSCINQITSNTSLRAILPGLRGRGLSGRGGMPR